MNYVSAVYFVVILIIVIDWFLRGRKEYRGQTARHEEAEKMVGGKETVATK
jgi:choline transport protein